MNGNLKELYDNRFQQEEKKQKNIIWKEICKYLTHIAGKEYNTVVDVAAGYCNFINFMECEGRRYAIDANPDVEKYAASEVTAIVDSVENLATYFKTESVSLFFMSNFLEHISKETISQLLETEYTLLEPGGELWILTPNIRYTGGKYWDFYDHITPITEKALIEAAEMTGYKIRKCIKKFIPYTSKSRLPQNAWIVRMYLRLMPLSGMLFGEQSFLIFVK